MFRKFMNFIDVATDFGAKNIRGSELLRMFGAAHGFSEDQINALRNQLEAKGVL